ncbi:MAG: TIGR00153 family protein [Gammaproteobacteria bacterium]|nr:TIGR00153 family protein [Gammaproteobacteria bacterium]NIN62192.1 TIGR00153 family protein [Gammaproteobacteria bacterium]NIO61930.1 TIGR00153 family protein [Gammaproteobacteria bacterium]NIP49084.1 TIGR00153 family protein [Gammaproteobacteria bacterium]NIQ09540.1 TIGR00153 family protein [Gammaproteobacteria bacterium]
MARSSYFSRIFVTSPVTPLQKHINSVVTCVELLPDYFEAVFDRDWERAVKIQAEIVSNEELCDTIKNELRLHLPSSLFMPIDRRDVLEVLDLQDAIANISKDIAGLILGRKLAIPKELRQQYLGFLDRCIDAARQAQVAINELDELVVTGFRGNEAERVKGMIRQLHTIEHETDEAQISLRAELYKLESDLPPVDVIFMYKVIDWTGDLADAALSTGNRLQLMLAK